MTKKELMIKAHEMTKNIKKEYSNVDYKFQLSLCLAYLYQEGEKEMITYTTKKGTKVEIALEGRVVADLKVNDIEVVKDNKDSNNVFVTTFDNTIVINSKVLCKKLGSTSVIRIAASEEIISIYKEAVQNDIEKENIKDARIYELYRQGQKRRGQTSEEVKLIFSNYYIDDVNSLC